VSILGLLIYIAVDCGLGQGSLVLVVWRVGGAGWGGVEWSGGQGLGRGGGCLAPRPL